MSKQKQKSAEEDVGELASDQEAASSHPPYRICWNKYLLSSKEKAVSGRVEGL